MQSLIFQQLETLERIQILEENAHEILPAYEYDKVLTDEDLIEIREQYAETMIEVEKLLEEKQRVLEEINEQLKGKKRVAKTELEKIRTGRERVTEKCFVIQDDVTGDFGTYNAQGQLLHERKARKGEQKGIKFYRGENENEIIAKVG